MAVLAWGRGEVSASWDGTGGETVVALTHGAGGDLDDPVLRAVGAGLASTGVAVVRFNLPYREAGRKAPGSQATSEACWRDIAVSLRDDYARTFLGGKSYGGRMATHVAADATPCDGLVLFSYPLHPPGKPERMRDAHLRSIAVPMLFCQGTRDPFATPTLLAATIAALEDATLHHVDGGDHSLRVRGREAGDVADELVAVIAPWLDT